MNAQRREYKQNIRSRITYLLILQDLTNAKINQLEFERDKRSKELIHLSKRLDA